MCKLFPVKGCMTEGTNRGCHPLFFHLPSCVLWCETVSIYKRGHLFVICTVTIWAGRSPAIIIDFIVHFSSHFNIILPLTQNPRRFEIPIFKSFSCASSYCQHSRFLTWNSISFLLGWPAPSRLPGPFPLYHCKSCVIGKPSWFAFLNVPYSSA